MKVLFYGDSITDAGRNRETTLPNVCLGYGYPTIAAGKMYEKDLGKYDVYNRGISGNRTVDIYARIKKDCWSIEPDVLSILIGVNDIWHDIGDHPNGVEPERFERIYRMILADTIERLPKTKIILCEPFALYAEANREIGDIINALPTYTRIVKKIAEEFKLPLVLLQDKLTEAGEKHGNTAILQDGIHPTVKGASVIAEEWYKVFEKVEAEM